MEVIHHGGHRTVTGSCHEFRYAQGRAVLIDCGLLQEDNHSDAAQVIDFEIDAIDALVITHSHLDHVGRIPWLLATGFRKPIFCTTATAELLPLILSDAIKIGITRDRKVIEGLLDLLQQLIRPLKYDQWLSISDDLMIRFRQAGHILGSAYVECEVGDQRIVFSGDIGCKNTPLLPDPTPLERADWLFLESTYGNRRHEPRRDRTARLSQVIQRCVDNKGAVLIPAFSIGRTQELLYDIEQIIEEMQRQPHDKYEFPVVVLDSPLAAAVTERYAKLKALWDDEAKDRIAKGRHPLDFSQLVTITSHADHERLVNRLRTTGEPVIVIAGAGMCTGGRIVNYLEALLPDPRTDVVFVGYQAYGTPGYQIQMFGPLGGYVELNGERIIVNAQIHTLGGYSAHADQQELLDFVGSADGRVKRVRLTHGDPAVQKVLAQKITEQFGIPVDAIE